MKHYIEITLIEDDKTLYESWSMLYSQLHFTLVNMHRKDLRCVGVDFPKYGYQGKRTLGDKLRIFASKEEILSFCIQDLKLRLSKYLPIFQNYYHFKSIKRTPTDCQHRCYARKRDKKSKEMLAVRMMKRQNISYQDALLLLQDYQPTPLDLPFILLKSQSSDAIFRCYIDKIDDGATYYNDSKEFDTYGLGGFVPFF